MKQKFLLLFAVSAMTFAGCGSDRNNGQDADSLMQDSAVMDTTDMGTMPADTTTMQVDSLNTDTNTVQ